MSHPAHNVTNFIDFDSFLGHFLLRSYSSSKLNNSGSRKDIKNGKQRFSNKKNLICTLNDYSFPDWFKILRTYFRLSVVAFDVFVVECFVYSVTTG